VAKKSIYMFGLSILIACVVWCQMGMYLVHLFFKVRIHANIFNFCIGLFEEGTFFYFLIVFLLNTLITYSLLYVLVGFGEQYILTRKLKKKLWLLWNHELTEKIIQSHQMENRDVLVINHKEVLAFTFGIRSPYIILSTGLLNLLERTELEAVIKHEMFHQMNRDPMKIFILSLIARSLWFIPLTKWLYKNYQIICEVLADEFAIKKTGSELGLSTALLKLIKNCFTDNPSPVLARFANKSVNYRLQQLIDPKHSLPLRLDNGSLIISFLVMFFGMVLVAAT
jgi:Zn-dependent protease with chaperone function